MKTLKFLRKRGLALFMALVMCLSLVQVTAFADTAAGDMTTWDGAVPNSATEAKQVLNAGSGTTDDPYQISTGRQLAALKYFLGTSNSRKVFKLMNDIDLANKPWTPIGSDQGMNAFQGTFMGNGKTIKETLI